MPNTRRIRSRKAPEVTIGQGGEAIIIVASSGEVLDQRLTYDLPEAHKTPTATSAFVASVTEAHPVPIEFGILGVLLVADEIYPTPQDPTTLELELLLESHPASYDEIALIGSVVESYPVAFDTVDEIIAVMDEAHPVPVEDVSGSEAVVFVAANSPASFDEITLDAAVVENLPVSVDNITLVTTVNETPPAAFDDLSNTEVVFVFVESAPAATDAVTLGNVTTNSVPAASDSVTEIMNADIWPDTGVTTTGFTNPGNATDKNLVTAATCSASSSGIGQTTSNVTNGTLVISAPNPQLSDLTSITSAIIRVSTNAANVSALSGSAISMTLAYSLNDGGVWTNIVTITTMEGAQTRTVDVTSLVANDWSKVNGFRLRATGTVTSGIGTGTIASVTTFSFLYGRLELVANRTY